jgi:hypothetical protein
MGLAKHAVLLPAVALLAGVTAALTQAAPAAAQVVTDTCYANTPFSFSVTSNTSVAQAVTNLPEGAPIPGKLPNGQVLSLVPGGANSDPPTYLAQENSGPTVVSFTNDATGKTINTGPGQTINASGPSWFSYDKTPAKPDYVPPGTTVLATGTYVADGETSQMFGPESEAALAEAGYHEPALIFVHGLLVMRFAVTSEGAPYVYSFSLLRGATQQNGCALLAGRG